MASFYMGRKRDIIYLPYTKLYSPPPKEHIQSSKLSKYIQDEMFGLKNYTPYTQDWFIATEQPSAFKFIKEHMKFLKNLPYREISILRTYTFFGDKFLNRFLRQNEEDIHDMIVTYLLYNDIQTPLDFQIYDNYYALKKKGLKIDNSREELLDEEGHLQRGLCMKIVRDNSDWFGTFKNIKPMIYDLFVEFMSIMLRAPPLKEPITVYRGVVSEHQKSLEFTSLDFWSTTLNPYHTSEFTKVDTSGVECCVYEIKVYPGIPCLYLGPFSRVVNEMEVLLPPSVFYKSAPSIREKGLYPPVMISSKQKIYTIALEAISFTTGSLSYKLLEKRWAEERARRLKRSHRRLKYTVNSIRAPKPIRNQTRKTVRTNSKYSENMPVGYKAMASHKKRSTHRHRPVYNVDAMKPILEELAEEGAGNMGNAANVD